LEIVTAEVAELVKVPVATLLLPTVALPKLMLAGFDANPPEPEPIPVRLIQLP
jgi:hypothetical protein